MEDVMVDGEERLDLVLEIDEDDRVVDVVRTTVGDVGFAATVGA
jgi:hypothetical protein